MKTIAIIPARGGSKRIPNKNSKLFGGLPLLVHSINYAKANNSLIDEIIVTTDSDEIVQIALQNGVKVFKRPAEISGDKEPTISALKHVLKNYGSEVENVVLLQPTNPLRPINLLNDAFELFENGYESLFTVSRSQQKLGKIQNEKFIPYNYEIGQRSQDLEPLYYENGLLYIIKAQLILENKIISENAFPFIVNHIFGTIDIDTQDDFDYATYLYQKLITHNS
jgi:CMP-N-acetylneuraminic acid synthetase